MKPFLKAVTFLDANNFKILGVKWWIFPMRIEEPLNWKIKVPFSKFWKSFTPMSTWRWFPWQLGQGLKANATDIKYYPIRIKIVVGNKSRHCMSNKLIWKPVFSYMLLLSLTSASISSNFFLFIILNPKLDANCSSLQLQTKLGK